MEMIRDALIALFAAIGAASVVWMAADALFSLGRGKLERTAAVISARGEAPALEQTVALLSKTRFGGSRFWKILVLDCGLNTEARARAILLSTQYGEVELCAGADSVEEIAKGE
jgi:hypothetical protein